MIYLDDDVSSWSHTEITYGCAPKIKAGLRFLERKAKEWGKSLSFKIGNYYTDYSEDYVVRYKGRIIEEISSETYSVDAFKQAAKSVGFDSVNSFHKFIKEYTGEEQTVTVYWDVEEYLPAGTYNVYIFADGTMIGQQSFSMK